MILLWLLVIRLTCDAEEVTSCCGQTPGSCPLYALLCHASGTESKRRIEDDAAAGIRTVGKRRETCERRFEGRLSQLLGGTRNRAAGILTMGKRTADTAKQPVHLVPIFETSPSFQQPVLERL
ncbi:hypothetical protein DPEC_G00277590 [Dallia pectoralis]|uniref:Uncharacterized protein n=1 Tax=Dallia pectoralis TaxID=75939 RepID=A0ACC2FLN7_DALPE|nr:hypothetical protein DPEC_G00277590 [Dallia pectoralis]